MDQTPNLNLPIPNDSADPPTKINAEFPRIALAFIMLDMIIHELQGVVADKADANHNQAMSTITGLVEALAAKMPANATFSLDDLTDVQGAAEAAVNYVLVKNAEGNWVPSSALAAIGVHEHSIAQVVGLSDLLEDIAELLADKADNNDLLGLVSETGTQTLSNKTLAAPVVNGPQGEFLRGAGNGLIMANDGADPNNRIVFSPGSFASDGATPVVMTLASALTKRLDAAWAVGNNQGGLDTGTKQPNTWYYSYLIRRSDTGVVDLLFSTSPTTPVMPSAAWDQKRRLRGAIRTDGSGNIRAFKQRGRRRFEFATRIDDISVASQVTTPILRTITVPPNMIGILQVQFAGAEYLEITNPDQPVINESATAGTTFVTSGRAGIRLTQSVDGASQIRTKVNGGSIPMYISTLGFEDGEF